MPTAAGSLNLCTAATQAISVGEAHGVERESTAAGVTNVISTTEPDELSFTLACFTFLTHALQQQWRQVLGGTVTSSCSARLPGSFGYACQCTLPTPQPGSGVPQPQPPPLLNSSWLIGVASPSRGCSSWCPVLFPPPPLPSPAGSPSPNPSTSCRPPCRPSWPPPAPP
jgi:hypothetical protein